MSKRSAEDRSRISKQEKAGIYAERLKVVLQHARDSGEFPRNQHGKISRTWLCKQIGRVGNLGQNPTIRADLEAFDSLTFPNGEPIKVEASVDPQPVTNIVDFDQPRLVRSKALARSGLIVPVNFAYDGELYLVPTVLWAYGIDEEVSDFCRSRIIKGVSYKTVYEDAKILKRFRAFCREQGWALAGLDDRRLRKYRRHVRHQDTEKLNHEKRNIWARTFNRYLSSIFAFLVWMELTRRLVGRVQLRNDERRAFALTGERVERTHKVRGKIVYWLSTIRLQDKKGKKSKLKNPDDTDIKNLHAARHGKRHATRDSLIWSWMEETGIRRFEVLSILIAWLPTREQLDLVRLGKRKWPIVLVRKGGGTSVINPSAELLERTLDYKENVRRKIVRSWTERKGKRESENLFLSQKTGNVLLEDSLTKIGTETFREAGIEDSTPHRLRGTFVDNQTETEMDAHASTVQGISPASNFFETVLTRIIEKTNHSRPEGLRPYLRADIHRRTRNAKAYENHDLDLMIKNKELYIEALERRLQRDRGLLDLLNRAQAGDQNAEWKILQVLEADVPRRRGRPKKKPD